MNGRTRAGVFTAGLTALLAVALLVGGVGGAAAADVEIANSTVGIDGDTQSVYADLNSSASSTANLTVTYDGIDADGNVTGTLDTRTVSLGAGNETLVKYSDVNASAYDSVRVTVTLDNTTADAANVSASTGSIQMVAGGGGGGVFDGLSRNGKIGIGVVVVLVVGLLARSDD